MRFGLGAVAAFLAILPAGAQAAPRLKMLDGARGPVLTDRHGSIAAMQTPGGDALLLDSRGRRRIVTAPQRTCDAAGKAPVAGVGGGFLLFAPCGDDGLVHDLATGAETSFSGPQLDEDPPPTSGVPDAIGSTWARIAEWSYHWTGFQYVNWHTGEVRDTGDAGTDPWPRHYPDLDRPDLLMPVCSPLRGYHSTDDGGELAGIGDAQHSYDRKWGIVLVGIYNSRWLVQRCGSKRPLLRMTCDCSQPQLGGGLLSWTRWYKRPAHARVNVLRLRDGHRFSWRVPRQYDATTAHIAGRLFLIGRAWPRPRILTASVHR
jgi:hypothetical protein